MSIFQDALWAQDCLSVRLFILITKSFPYFLCNEKYKCILKTEIITLTSIFKKKTKRIGCFRHMPSSLCRVTLGKIKFNKKYSCLISAHKSMRNCHLHCKLYSIQFIARAIVEIKTCAKNGPMHLRMVLREVMT